MSSHTLSLIDLPLEIFRTILVEAVRLRSVKRALRLRLINKLFSDELVEALCVSNVIAQCYVNLSEWPYVRPYIEKRLVERRTKGLPTLHTIRKAAEILASQDEAQFNYREYVLQLLHLASTIGFRNVVVLLSRRQERYREEDFQYDLLSAAAFTNNIPLVKSLRTKLWLSGGIFSDAFRAAVLGGSHEALMLLLTEYKEKYIWSAPYNEGLLSMAAQQGDVETVLSILQSVHNPVKRLARHPKKKDPRLARYPKPKGPYKWFRTKAQITSILLTPSVEIFKIILKELKSRKLAFLGAKLLLRTCLLHAIRHGWADMTSYLIMRGVPIGVPIKNGWHLEAPLFWACYWGHDNIVKLLFDSGAQICGSELSIAASHGHTSIVKSLLEKGADVHAMASKDALYGATRKGYVCTARALLDAGMDPNNGNIPPLVGAVESEHVDMFQMLIQRGAVVPCVLPEATKAAEAAGLESMLALLSECQTTEYS